MSRYINVNDYKVNYGELRDFTPDQTVILNKCYLKLIARSRYKEQLVEPAKCDEWYPQVNSYYYHTEDVDAFARVNHLLDERPSLCSLASACGSQDIPCGRDAYASKLAQLKYLNTKAICFLVLGKPGLNQEEIARRLADHWKCLYIDPQILLEDEIRSDSRAGQCIEFNLRCGRAVGVDVIMRLLAKKIQTKSAKHRGYVIAGFPLIRNDLFEEDPISSESAIFNVKEIFEDIVENALNFDDISKRQVSMSSRTKSAVSSLSSKTLTEEVSQDTVCAFCDYEFSMDSALYTSNVCIHSEISPDIHKQINLIFGLLTDPYVIIYVACPTDDVILRRSELYFDIYSKRSIDAAKIKLFYRLGGVVTNPDLTRDLFEVDVNPLVENPNLRHLVRVPENFECQVATQLDRYYAQALSLIDQKVLLHDAQYYMKVDGRAFISRTLENIKLRLRTLPVQKVVIPERLNLSFQLTGEDKGDATDDALNITVDEAYVKFSKRQIVQPGFNWLWSDWKNFCPVSMKDGSYRKGSPKHAVHFMNRIFFLSDENAVNSFVENPRGYLMPPFPKVSCKIFVFGPPTCGKSSLATCLSYLLGGCVLQPRQMYLKYVKLKELELKEKVRQSALIEGVKLLEERNLLEFEENKRERRRLVQEWQDSCRFRLESIVEYLNQPLTSLDNVSSFPVALEQKHRESYADEVQNKIFVALDVFKIPANKDSAYYNDLLVNPSQLEQFLPDYLKSAITLKEASIFHPFVEKFANEKVDTIKPEDIEVSPDDIFDVYYNGIKEVEVSSSGGWVLDGMTTDLEMLKRLCEDFKPHEVFILTGSDNFLTKIYDEHDQFFKFRDFEEFFLALGENDAAWRTPSIISTDTFKHQIVEEVLDEILTKCAGSEDMVEHREKYLTKLAEFNAVVPQIRQFFRDLDCDTTEIDVSDHTIDETMKEVIEIVGNKFRQKAALFTDDDRAEEVQEFLSLQGNVKSEEGEKEPQVTLEQRRKFGDTSIYCPVTFKEHWVLWKGKEEFTAKYKGRIYLCSSESDLLKFIASPKTYLLQIKPHELFPPPRICVVGVSGSGKTTLSNILAENLGVRYLNYPQFLSDEVNSSKTTILSDNLDLDSYLSDDAPLPDHVLQKLASGLWLEPPVKHIGFVIDGFPMRPSDVKFMTTNKLIPDAIVCLSVEQGKVSENLLKSSVDKWRVQQQDDLKNEERNRFRILEEWENKRKERFDVLMEEKRQIRYSSKLEEFPTIPEEGDLRSNTQISVDSVAEQEDTDEIAQTLDEELPEPKFVEKYETEQQATERLVQSIGDDYLKEIKYLYDMKASCQIQSIPWMEIDANVGADQTIAQAFRLTDPIKFRNQSLFEICLEVFPEIAEKLLNQGYYFLSRFGKTCPVQMYDDFNPIQMFLPSELNGTLHTIIHRQYVYFIVGDNNRDRFFDDPLKFTTNDVYNMPLIPMRLAVIGPPKCGKSRLAQRYGRDYGFKVITRGQSMRSLYYDLPFSNLTRTVEDALRRAEEVDVSVVMRSVESAIYDGHAMSQGVIFDGFPNTKSELEWLNRYGLVPHLIFDLQPKDVEIFKNAESFTPMNSNLPRFSRRFVKHVLSDWSEGAGDYRHWTDREFQNMFELKKTKQSLWGVWHDSLQVSLAVCSEIKHYFKHANDDWPLRIANMLITPLEFLERQSGYKTYCPVCWKFDRLKTGGDPPDRTGLIHYRNHFYWLCPIHIEDFLKIPEAYVPPLNKSLPSNMPMRITLSKDEPIANLVEDALCVVCYENGKPERHLTKGSVQYAILYCGRTFLFDAIECLNEFMSCPQIYSKVVIRFKTPPCYASLAYGDLPILGLLEQYLARKLVKAIHHVGIHRPVIPGLGIATSALIGIGLFLKVHDDSDRIGNHDRVGYTRALEKFNKRRNNFLENLRFMKAKLNPFLKYSQPDTSDSFDSFESDVDTCVWEVVDEIIDKIV